jgi:AcrR family transcriptional regulator
MVNTETVRETMARRDPGGGMREAILDAAVEAIADHGWGNVTTRRIAERAGVNNALIHYYFGSKDELLRRAVTERFAVDFEAPLAALAGAGDIHEGIDAFFDGIERLAGDSRLLVSTEALLQGMRDPVIRRWAREVIGEAIRGLGALVTEGQATGTVNAGLDADGSATVLVAALDSIVLYRLVDDQLDLTGARTTLHRMFEPRGAT